MNKFIKGDILESSETGGRIVIIGTKGDDYLYVPISDNFLGSFMNIEYCDQIFKHHDLIAELRKV